MLKFKRKFRRLKVNFYRRINLKSHLRACILKCTDREGLHTSLILTRRCRGGVKVNDLRKWRSYYEMAKCFTTNCSGYWIISTRRTLVLRNALNTHKVPRAQPFRRTFQPSPTDTRRFEHDREQNTRSVGNWTMTGHSWGKGRRKWCGVPGRQRLLRKRH